MSSEIAMGPNFGAFVACLAGAILEGILSGRGVRTRFLELRLPPYSPSFMLWGVIGLAYYGYCFVLLRYLFAVPDRTILDWTAIGLVGVVMVLNGVWNYLFFRRKTLRGALRLFVPYTVVVAALVGVTAVVYPFGAALGALYCAYLAYVVWWTCRLVRINEEIEKLRSPD